MPLPWIIPGDIVPTKGLHPSFITENFPQSYTHLGWEILKKGKTRLVCTKEKSTFSLHELFASFYGARIGNTAYATNHRVATADYEVVVVVTTVRGYPPPFTVVVFFAFFFHFFVVSARRWGYDVIFTLSVLSVSYQ